MNKQDEQLSDKEIERRMQDAIQRALNTPPKPFTRSNGDKKKKRGRQSKKTEQEDQS